MKSTPAEARKLLAEKAVELDLAIRLAMALKVDFQIILTEKSDVISPKGRPQIKVRFPQTNGVVG